MNLFRWCGMNLINNSLVNKKLNIIAGRKEDLLMAKSLFKKYLKMNKGDPAGVRRDILNYVVNSIHGRICCKRGK